MTKGELLARAQAAYGRGDFKAAGNLCEQLLAVSPNHSEGTLLLANVCMRVGRLDSALTRLQNLIRREPNSYQANAEISGLLFHLGLPKEARLHGRRALELQPNNPNLHANLVVGLKSAGLVDEAQEQLTQSIEDHANNRDFLRALADALIQAKLYVEAVRALEQIAKLAPNEYLGWLILGRIRVGAGDFEGALLAGLEAVRLNPQSAEAHLMLAMLYDRRQDEGKSAPHYLHVIELKPDDEIALSALGVIRQHQGQFEESTELLRRAVNKRPTNGFAQQLLSRSHRMSREETASLESLVNDARATPIDRIYLNFTVGKGWEDVGEYEKSMRAYDAGNALNYDFWLKGKAWDRKRDQDFFTDCIRTYSADSIKAFPSKKLIDANPILIVGMPRSGTSLVEQIVSSHPKVCGGGELEFWIDRAPEVLKIKDSDARERELLTLGKQYLDLLKSSGGETERVTDKLPQNFSVLGMICSALPETQVIHVRRNPIDTCLSIYATPFGQPAIFTHRKEDIAFMYREYLRLMEHWRQVLEPTRFLEVDYEEIISSRGTVTRRMIEFLSLPWDDACLNYQKNERNVKTASVWQVRQPIYPSAIGRGINFKPWIGEFLDLADDDAKL